MYNLVKSIIWENIENKVFTSSKNLQTKVIKWTFSTDNKKTAVHEEEHLFYVEINIIKEYTCI